MTELMDSVCVFLYSLFIHDSLVLPGICHCVYDINV